ncbi:MAG: hypothetical protein HKP40_01900 [Litoreibacter sp.]|nr:hypothetical protein [Litoreibacter sp.]
MKKRLFYIATALILSAVPAQAECYVDYKAKKDRPLKLHYGVMQVPDNACGSRRAAAAAIAPRLASAGWTLLSVVSIFDRDGLAKRKKSAGSYFLRF